MPEVSFVMPVYNAGKYIKYAIESVINQSYKDWELVIVDDCSTDDSYEIANEYKIKDERIRLYRLKKNSGSAHHPRSVAKRLATGKYFCMIDADDMVAVDYLEILVNKMRETDADIVCSRIWVLEDDDTLSRPLPSEDFDFNQILTGRETLSYTINGWRISSCGLIKKEINKTADMIVNVNKELINADELHTRIRFMCSDKIAFTKAVYKYRNNTASISKSFSLKRFGYIQTSETLIQIIKEKYGTNSIEFKQANLQYCNSILKSVLLLIEHEEEIGYEDFVKIKSELASHWKKINFSLILKLIPVKTRLFSFLGFKLSYSLLYYNYHAKQNDRR